MVEGCAYLKEGYFLQSCTKVSYDLAATLVVNQDALLSLSHELGT